MFVKLCYVILLTCCGVIQCKRFRSDYTYYSTVDSWLKFHAVPVTWLEAQQWCFLEGALLASPVDAKWEAAIVAESNKSTSECSAIYTGIHSIFSKGYFHSIEGVPLTKMSLQWMSGEPDNFDNSENCIVYSDSRIADVNCSKMFPFVCYKKKTESMSVMACGTIDREYEPVGNTGSCYKFHNHNVPWAEAYKICAAEGAYLAIINSNAEADMLSEHYKKNLKNTTSIGIHDWYKDGVWRTVHGQTLEEAGYDSWSHHQPNNRSPGQACGGLTGSGLLNDYWCDKPNKFLCEKDPDSLQD